MSKLTKHSDWEIKQAKRVFLMLVGKDIVALQGARIIGKMHWEPKKQDAAARDIERETDPR